MTNDAVREICAEIETQRYQTSFPASQVLEWRDRILAAYERELAAKDAAHQQWRKNYHAQLAEKDAEIARLKAALKPVMNLDMSRFGFTVDYGECFNAVREAKRIYKEGVKK